MRTRSHDYLPSPPPSSPPPSAQSRKRSLPSSPLKSSLRDQDPAADDDDDDPAFSTPRKIKRVRFSDPGPVEDVGLGISSSGLTPSFRRTRLSSAHDAAARRRTLPARLEHSSSSPPPPPKEIQFLPLRQVLDNRMRRRLRRNHLSEAVNDIEQQERDAHKTRRELEQLRASGQNSDLKIKELMFELESQRQLGIAVTAEDESEHAALQEELQRLKFELLHYQEAPPRRKERLPLGASTEVATDNGDNPRSSPTRTSSPFDFETFDDAASPLLPAAGDDDPPSSPFLAPTPTPTHTHTGVQTNLPDLFAERHLAQLNRQQAALKTAQREASDARAALTSLGKDLNSLGFAPATSTPDETIAAIRAAFRATRLDLERILPGETPAGFENATLLPALTNHVRRQAAALADAHAARDALRAEHTALRTNFNAALATHADLENRQTVLLAERSTHAAALADRDEAVRERDAAIARLEADLAAARAEGTEQRVGLARLHAALDSYRGEVAGLERLVGELEAGRAAAQREADRAGTLDARGRSLAEVVEGTRAFLERHISEARGRVGALVEGHEAACVAAEEFLRRGVAL